MVVKVAVMTIDALSVHTVILLHEDCLTVIPWLFSQQNI